MLQIGDFVSHQKGEYVGKVVGYGHQILDGVYLPTLIVRLVEATALTQRGFIEDLSSAWMRTENSEGRSL